jgi:hypothetical protein
VPWCRLNVGEKTSTFMAEMSRVKINLFWNWHCEKNVVDYFLIFLKCWSGDRKTCFFYLYDEHWIFSTFQEDQKSQSHLIVKKSNQYDQQSMQKMSPLVAQKSAVKKIAALSFRARSPGHSPGIRPRKGKWKSNWITVVPLRPSVPLWPSDSHFGQDWKPRTGEIPLHFFEWSHVVF